MVRAISTGNSMRRNQEGATFLWAMLLLVIMVLGLSRLLDIQTTRIQRIMEEQLLWTGEQYRRAIEEYYKMSPGQQKQLPGKLEDLLLDPRLLTMTRHLREIYHDPLTNQPFIAIYSHEGELVGVRSSSTKRPLKIDGFDVNHAHFSKATGYHQWEFIFLP